MTRESNLYHNFVVDEDTLTELVANLLQFQTFRDIFSKLMAEKLDLPDFSFQYAHVETQQSVEAFGKPDLIIENESFCIFIECKVTDFRELTPHQPDSYLNYLDSMIHKKCALVFLIPYYYEHEAAIQQRAKACGSSIQPELIYWTELIDRIESSKIADQNIAIEHFASILHTRFDYHPIIFSEEEMMMMQDQEFPALLLKLIELVKEVSYKFPKSFKTEELFNEYGFGYYVKNKRGEYLLWFGCDYIIWKEQGHCFVVGVGEEEDVAFSQVVIQRFKAIFDQEVKVSTYEWGTWYMVPISESLIGDPHKVKKLVQFIANAAEQCNAVKVAE